ncbi:hypothetical protein ACIQPP_21635 [Streptomyces violaceusniger]|nr:hypothetical protein [Streptomyces hygroscopicus]
MTDGEHTSGIGLKEFQRRYAAQPEAVRDVPPSRSGSARRTPRS